MKKLGLAVLFFGVFAVLLGARFIVKTTPESVSRGWYGLTLCALLPALGGILLLWSSRSSAFTMQSKIIGTFALLALAVSIGTVPFGMALHGGPSGGLGAEIVGVFVGPWFAFSLSLSGEKRPRRNRRD